MIEIDEGQLRHSFDPSWRASKYDEWSFFTRHFRDSMGGNKAVDVIAQSPDTTLWLVELKDYRVHPRTKPLELAEEIAVKVRDTLAGVFAAAKWHAEHPQRESSRKHLAAKRLRVVLHLEQPARHSRLFPREFDLSKIQQKLKQLVKSVDPHPLVVEVATASLLPWSVQTI